MWTTFYNFIYLFSAMLGLCCCVQAFFSSGGEQGLMSSGWASHCAGLSKCYRAQTVGAEASVVVTFGLQRLPLLGPGGQAQ